MSLRPSSKSNPCPICEATSGKCQQGREDENYNHQVSWHELTADIQKEGRRKPGLEAIAEIMARLSFSKEGGES